MNDDLESQLRQALRPVAPDAQFQRRLMSKIAAGSAAPIASKTRWIALAAAASAAVFGVALQVHLRHARDDAAGLDARRQVIEALRVTDQQLDLAVRTVRENSNAAVRDAPGA